MSIFKIISKGADIVSKLANTVGNIVNCQDSNGKIYSLELQSTTVPFAVTGPITWTNNNGDISMLNTTPNPVSVVRAEKSLINNGKSQATVTTDAIIPGLSNHNAKDFIENSSIDSIISVSNTMDSDSLLSFKDVFAGKIYGLSENTRVNYSVTNMNLDVPFKITGSIHGKISVFGEHGDNLTLVLNMSGWPGNSSGVIQCSISTNDGSMYDKTYTFKGGEDAGQIQFDINVAQNITLTSPSFPMVSITVDVGGEYSSQLRADIQKGTLHPISEQLKALI